jgi:hypothetical protein
VKFIERQRYSKIVPVKLSMKAWNLLLEDGWSCFFAMPNPELKQFIPDT